MAAQRLLSGVVALAAVALAGEGRAAAQATKPAAPLPRWVRGSAGTDASAAAGLKLAKVPETASLDRPFATAKEVGGAAVAVRNAFETNARLLASRKRPPVALLTKYGTVLKTAVRVIDPATDLPQGKWTGG